MIHDKNISYCSQKIINKIFRTKQKLFVLCNNNDKKEPKRKKKEDDDCQRKNENESTS